MHKLNAVSCAAYWTLFTFSMLPVACIIYVLSMSTSPKADLHELFFGLVFYKILVLWWLIGIILIVLAKIILLTKPRLDKKGAPHKTMGMASREFLSSEFNDWNSGFRVSNLPSYQVHLSSSVADTRHGSFVGGVPAFSSRSSRCRLIAFR